MLNMINSIVLGLLLLGFKLCLGGAPNNACLTYKFKQGNNENIQFGNYSRKHFRGFKSDDKLRWVDDTHGPTEYNADWMKNLDDNIWLSSITLPGTHQSVSFHGYYASCQSWWLWQQLMAGIRYIDMRVKLEMEGGEETFKIYHGSEDQEKNFTNVTADCRDFLAAHPTEIIFMRVAKVGNRFDRDMLRVFNAKYKDPQLMYTRNANVRLGTVRGKLIILRDISGFPGLRFNKYRFSGCDKWDYGQLTNWATCTTKANDKTANVEYSLEKATEYFESQWTAKNPLQNPVATTNVDQSFWYTGLNAISIPLCNPYDFAKKVNKKIYEHIKRKDYNKMYGMVVMDYPGISLTSEVIKYNKRIWNFPDFGSIGNGNNVTLWNVQYEEYLYATTREHGSMRRYIRTYTRKNVEVYDGYFIEMKNNSISGSNDIVVYLNECYQEFLYSASQSDEGDNLKNIYTWRALGDVHKSMKWEKKAVGSNYVFKNQYYPGVLMCAADVDDDGPYMRFVYGRADLSESDKRCQWQVRPA